MKDYIPFILLAVVPSYFIITCMMVVFCFSGTQGSIEVDAQLSKKAWAQYLAR